MFFYIDLLMNKNPLFIFNSPWKPWSSSVFTGIGAHLRGLEHQGDGMGLETVVIWQILRMLKLLVVISNDIRYQCGFISNHRFIGIICLCFPYPLYGVIWSMMGIL